MPGPGCLRRPRLRRPSQREGQGGPDDGKVAAEAVLDHNAPPLPAVCKDMGLHPAQPSQHQTGGQHEPDAVQVNLPQGGQAVDVAEHHGGDPEAEGEGVHPLQQVVVKKFGRLQPPPQQHQKQHGRDRIKGVQEGIKHCEASLFPSAAPAVSRTAGKIVSSGQTAGFFLYYSEFHRPAQDTPSRRKAGTPYRSARLAYQINSDAGLFRFLLHQNRVDAHLLALLIDIEAGAGLAAQVAGGHHLPQQVSGRYLVSPRSM